MWTGQWLHAIGLIVLATLAGLAWWKLGPLEGAFLGLSADAWFWLSLAVPVVMQVFVWVCWRLELVHDKAVSRSIGFGGFFAGFMICLFGRFLAVLGLAIANRETLGMHLAVRVTLATVSLLLAAWTGYSLIRYFGLKRASGADHFEERYRKMPLVDKGIFRYTKNGMYGPGFLGLWGLAVAFDSVGALLASAFGHAYICVHHLATEKPDMDSIYG